MRHLHEYTLAYKGGMEDAEYSFNDVWLLLADFGRHSRAFDPERALLVVVEMAIPVATSGVQDK